MSEISRILRLYSRIVSPTINRGSPSICHKSTRIRPAWIVGFRDIPAGLLNKSVVKKRIESIGKKRPVFMSMIGTTKHWYYCI